MGFWSSVVSGVQAGITAFRQAQLDANPQRKIGPINYAEWTLWPSRRARYELYWALYQNNLYQHHLHPGISQRYMAEMGMYRYSRHIYSPFYALGEFFASKLMGGTLDQDAGDGEETPTALPILTDNEALRPAIGQLWRDSRWQITKDTYTRYGAVLGDVGLKVCDDPLRQRVYLEVVHPGTIEWVDRDRYGNVKSYIIQEERWDPRYTNLRQIEATQDPQGRQRQVTYREEAYRDGGDVVFATFLNGEQFDWRTDSDGNVRGTGANAETEWRQPYGFTPLVLVEHMSLGMGWGMNCFHCGLSLGRELDDLGSITGDQIRKALKAPILVTGAADPATPKPGTVFKSPTQQPTITNPLEGRNEQPFYYVPDKDVRAEHMTFNLDLPGVLQHLKLQIDNLHDNFPELLATIHTAAGDASGRALRVARQQASEKVQTRRAAYDDGLVRAQAMAITMGGIGGYPGYQGFSESSYEAGQLDHQIGQRPVFEVDPLDDLEEDQAFWTAAGLAVKAGLPLETFLVRNGWTEADIKAMQEHADNEAETNMQRASAVQAKRFAAVDMGGMNGNGKSNGAPTNGDVTEGDGY